MSRFQMLSDTQWELIAPMLPTRTGRAYAHLKQWRGLATRYDKYAIVYRSAVVLNAVIAWSKRLSDMP